MIDKPYLLVVEDDAGLREQLRWTFESFEVIFATNRTEAIAQLRHFEPKVVTLDLGLPPHPAGFTEGLSTLKEILAIAPNTKVIMVTGHIEQHIAIQAIHLGAYDYCMKPIDSTSLQLIIARAFYLQSLESEHQQLMALSESHPLKGVVTHCPKMQQVCRTLQKIAPNNISVMLLGESGTGKEVLTKALHAHSDRSDGPFVAINCAAIPENLLESELFGYEKGAFTGAAKQTLGKIELAHKGTLFLDEIGDLPLSLQPKLLRFLQERVIERLGGRSLIPVDVRVVCATHQALPDLIRQQMFREDLYYRLSEVTIPIPPLRERLQDSILLARAFLIKFSKEFKKPVRRISEDALSAIEAYPWPGNVRELENKMKRAVIMAEEAFITRADLGLPNDEIISFPFNLKQVRDKAEKEAVLRALQYVEGNMSKAAELLGVTRPTLYSVMEKLGLSFKSTIAA